MPLDYLATASCRWGQLPVGGSCLERFIQKIKNSFGCFAKLNPFLEIYI